MTEKHSIGWTRDGAEIALNGLEDYMDQTRQALDDAFKQVAELEADKAALEQRVERLESGHQKIIEWAKAYPLDVFPEPDFKKAAQVLKDAGMTLDAISASNMRHVIEGVEGIAEEALASQEEGKKNERAF